MVVCETPIERWKEAELNAEHVLRYMSMDSNVDCAANVRCGFLSWPSGQQQRNEQKKFDGVFGLKQKQQELNIKCRGVSECAAVTLSMLQHLHFVRHRHDSEAFPFVTPLAVANQNAAERLLSSHLAIVPNIRIPLVKLIPLIHEHLSPLESTSNAVTVHVISLLYNLCRDLIRAMDHCDRSGLVVGHLSEGHMFISHSGQLILGEIAGAHWVQGHNMQTWGIDDGTIKRVKPEPRKSHAISRLRLPPEGKDIEEPLDDSMQLEEEQVEEDGDDMYDDVSVGFVPDSPLLNIDAVATTATVAKEAPKLAGNMVSALNATAGIEVILGVLPTRNSMMFSTGIMCSYILCGKMPIQVTSAACSAIYFYLPS